MSADVKGVTLNPQVSTPQAPWRRCGCGWRCCSPRSAASRAAETRRRCTSPATWQVRCCAPCSPCSLSPLSPKHTCVRQPCGPCWSASPRHPARCMARHLLTRRASAVSRYRDHSLALYQEPIPGCCPLIWYPWRRAGAGALGTRRRPAPGSLADLHNGGYGSGEESEGPAAKRALRARSRAGRTGVRLGGRPGPQAQKHTQYSVTSCLLRLEYVQSRIESYLPSVFRLYVRSLASSLLTPPRVFLSHAPDPGAPGTLRPQL